MNPPEILADLMDSGICLAGGTSQLQGLAERLANEIRCVYGSPKTLSPAWRVAVA